MRSILMSLVLVVLASTTAVAAVDPAEAWRPLQPFIGEWKRVHADGGKSSRRVVANSEQRRLEILDRASGQEVVRGILRLDAERGVLTLQYTAVGGDSDELTLDRDGSSEHRLVFQAADTTVGALRLTWERDGVNAFTERLERSDGAAPATARFERKR